MNGDFDQPTGAAQTAVISAPTQALLHPKLRLEVMAGIDLGAVAVTEARLAHVGTQPGNTLQLRDEAVSRIHLAITPRADGLALRDLASTNGSWLAGNVRLREALVPSGTLVQVGRSQVRVETLAEQVAEPLSALPVFGRLIGVSPAMRAVFALLERVAPTDETVLITGETGTGKEFCAQSIAERSPRAQRPFVVVDCGAIPPNLLESELFGHTRGAFTSAHSDYAGAFERAEGGTIFLDEIGELPLELQTRLLRAVEQRTIRRVGGGRDLALDLRIIAATNRCLEEEVNRGAFRADLYYRLSVFQVRMPPLRERPEDLEPLARLLLDELGAGGRAALDPALNEQLRGYAWPGNVRELRNHLRRLALGAAESLGAGAALAGGLGGGAAQPAPSSLALDLAVSFREAKEQAVGRFERAYLEALLRHTGGNVSQAARLAQTDRTYLSRLLLKHGVSSTR
ncbi:MAG: sigma 54-dependent Fis family transcriptional regulator [Proteobacteria bacterium]|nr:sigma 54-dependent Fis family transcriptional regulator [Pseudomonadota bacterium]